MRRRDQQINSDLAGLSVADHARLEQVKLAPFAAWARCNWTGLGCFWSRRASLTLLLELCLASRGPSICYEVIGATL